ncbi:peroxisome assembly protein 12 [Aricia agestis]|uniref:peroxisome assembly protein 12 n=1 Tax=Aricia agestis TaxID=91739 RepID=UPI001C20AA8C|nr:peroxisome assembly protein 12 [Aricia agestis]
MAVYAAHLTRTLQGTPSVFQITAQEALGATVKPAFRRLVQYLSEVYPNKWGWCERYFDEVFLAADCILQYYYLKHYAGSFSECFYGLLRTPITPSDEFSSGTRLPDALEKGSLALLVLAPYLKDKAEKIVDKWRDDSEAGILGRSKSDQARRAAIKLYSIMYFIMETSKLLILARYLMAREQAPTLPLYLLGLTLKDAPPEEPDNISLKDVVQNFWTRDLEGEAIGRWALRALGRGAQYSLFALQLLRWWAARGPALQALPAPPAPQKPERATRFTNLCPVCMQSWKVPTVLPVSGYVYCYTCISRALRRGGRCPTTGLPASEGDLRRLYLVD